MKTFKKILKFAICLTATLFIASGACVYAYTYFNQTAQSATLAQYEHLTENFYAETTMEEADISPLLQFIADLPQNIGNTFQRDWKVIIFEDNLPLKEEDSYSAIANINNAISGPFEVSGYCDWRNRLIWIKNNSDTDRLLNVFSHEFGHLFDFEFGLISESKEFLGVYNLCKNTFVEADPYAVPGYATISSSEFFATIFKEYHLYPDHLQATAPEAYALLHDAYSKVASQPSDATTLQYDLESVFRILQQLAERIKAHSPA